MAIENSSESDQHTEKFDLAPLRRRVDNDFPWSRLLNLEIRLRRRLHLLRMKDFSVACFAMVLARLHSTPSVIDSNLDAHFFSHNRTEVRSPVPPIGSIRNFRRFLDEFGWNLHEMRELTTMLVDRCELPLPVGSMPRIDNSLSVARDNGWLQLVDFGVQVPEGPPGEALLNEIIAFIESEHPDFSALRLRFGSKNFTRPKSDRSVMVFLFGGPNADIENSSYKRRFPEFSGPSLAEEDTFSLIAKAFESEGVKLSGAAGSFLEKFGGAVVRYQFNESLTDVLDFCADDAVCGMGDGILSNLEERLNVGMLCPVGGFCFGMRNLLMNADGAVYGVGDEGVARIASSGEEAIDLILSGKLSDRPFEEFTL